MGISISVCALLQCDFISTSLFVLGVKDILSCLFISLITYVMFAYPTTLLDYTKSC